MTREEAIRCLSVHSSTNGSGLCTDEQHYEAKQMAIKALEQEPCGDEYIKVPKKALKYRTAGMIAYNAEWLKNHFDLERAVICGAQEPQQVRTQMSSADCISRQAVHEAITRWAGSMSVLIALPTREVRPLLDSIHKLQPINPQPTGHWYIDERPESNRETICSNCEQPILKYHKLDFDYRPKHCPNCGARMVEPQESEEV